MGGILLALALVMGGCGGDVQEEQKDVKEAQKDQGAKPDDKQDASKPGGGKADGSGPGGDKPGKEPDIKP